MNSEQMLGQKFLKEIDAEDADSILKVLKQYGNNELIDKWVSVKMIATEVRKTQKAEIAVLRSGYKNPTDRPINLFWDRDEDWRVEENGNPYDNENNNPEN